MTADRGLDTPAVNATPGVRSPSGASNSPIRPVDLSPSLRGSGNVSPPDGGAPRLQRTRMRPAVAASNPLASRYRHGLR
jgi:hypothetical protein